MKISIRSGCFETNSSSMHSVVVKKEGGYYSPEEIKENIWLSDDRETGEKGCILRLWDKDLYFERQPFRAIADFKTKWLYAYASMVREYNDDEYKELERIALKYIPGLKKIELPLETRYLSVEEAKTKKEVNKYLDKLSEKINYQIEEYSKSGEYWVYRVPDSGYAGGDLSSFLNSEGISLEEFIANKKYIVIQDGDEYGYFNDMKSCGLISEDAIDHERGI